MEKGFETERVSDCLTKLRFSIPAEEVTQAVQRAFEAVRNEAVIPGFRKGKAPRPMIERKFGRTIREEAFSRLLPEHYYEAIKKEGIRPIADPTFDDIKHEKDQPLTFTATVETLPDIQVPDFRSIEIKKAEVKEPSEEEIQHVIDMHRDYLAKYEPVEGEPVQEGHFVQVNLDQEIDGEKNSRENQMIEVNKEKIFPEFASELVGMKPGEKKSFDLSFPEDYQSKEVAGKTIHYEVELNEIKKKVMPELDDDFAKDTGRAETLDGLKEDISKSILKTNEEKARSEDERQILDALLDKADFDVPPSMLKAQADSNFRRSVQMGMYSGVPKDELEKRGKEMFEKATEDSKRQIKTYLLLGKIAEAEKITVSDEELDNHIKQMAQMRRTDEKTLREQLEKEDEMGSVKNQLVHEKAMNFLYDNVKKN